MQEDYQGPGWQRLADAEPPQLTLCDWVLAAEGYTERGTGIWFRGPNAGGFDTPNGCFVSDPERTYWKAVEPQPDKPRVWLTGYQANDCDASQQWQPIETAPRDRIILLYRPTETRRWLSVATGEYDDDSQSAFPEPFWYSFDEYGEFDDRQHPPTHWMPIPPPPTTI